MAPAGRRVRSSRGPPWPSTRVTTFPGSLPIRIAIVGAAYTGLAAARHLRRLGHTISVNTTRAERVSELQQVADLVVVTKGSDAPGMRELIADAHVVVLTMAGGLGVKDGKPYMDPVAYRDSYVGTAEGLAMALDAAPELRQIVFCSSMNAYGDAHGATPVTEDTPPNAASPAAQVYVEIERQLAALGHDRLSVCNFRTGTIYPSTRQGRATVPLHRAARGGDRATLAHRPGAGALHAQDPVPRRHDPRHL
ncbi:MAG: NAD-dependent epimerase/dehydratase family protein [Phycisphaeraceae bacterium]|nr:NAD-dependent epimerase/dehydratase family protein [Phycisphaeraceae bacterium]